MPKHLLLCSKHDEVIPLSLSVPAFKANMLPEICMLRMFEVTAHACCDMPIGTVSRGFARNSSAWCLSRKLPVAKITSKTICPCSIYARYSGIDGCCCLPYRWPVLSMQYISSEPSEVDKSTPYFRNSMFLHCFLLFFSFLRKRFLSWKYSDLHSQRIPHTC